MQTNPFDEDTGYSHDYDEAARFHLTLDPAQMMQWLLRSTAADFNPGNWSDARRKIFPAATSQTNDLAYTFTLNSDQQRPRMALIEIQLAPQRRMAGRMLNYAGYVLADVRPNTNKGDEYFPVPVVINLTKRGNATREMQMINKLGISIRTSEWNLSKLNAEAILVGYDRKEVPWPVLAWVPLMRNGGDEKIVQDWRERILAIPSARDRGDLIALVMIYAGPLKRRKIWKKAVEGIDVIESKQVQIWKREGRLEATQNNLIMVLQKRFGVIPESDIAIIQAITNLDRCTQLLIEAAVCGSLEDFQMQLLAP